MIVDTHIHLDDGRYVDDLDEVLNRARSQDVERFIIPGADPDTLNRAISLSEKHDDIYFSVGVHPYDKEHFSSELLEGYITHPKCVAVGECGLDYYRFDGQTDIKKEKQAQKEVFEAHIALAKRYKKPLIVHIREASTDAKAILLDSDASEVGGVLHCYNANETLLELSEHNFFFGIGGVVTFKNAKKLIQVLPKIPMDKLLIETDGPYLTPHPHRGERNEPAHCTLIAEKIAALLHESAEEVALQTTRNAEKLFKLNSIQNPLK